VPHGPAFPDRGQDDDPALRPGEPDQTGEVPEGWRELAPSREDWLTEDQWVAWLSEIEPEEWATPGEDPGDNAGEDPGDRLPKGIGRPSKGGRRPARSPPATPSMSPPAAPPSMAWPNTPPGPMTGSPAPATTSSPASCAPWTALKLPPPRSSTPQWPN
jgi:hypothetical protein